MTSEWARWRLKSPASRLFTQSFIQTQIKENIKAPRHWPLCGEFTGTGEFPAQRASYAENVSIWWRHHGMYWRRLISLTSLLSVQRRIQFDNKEITDVLHYCSFVLVTQLKGHDAGSTSVPWGFHVFVLPYNWTQSILILAAIVIKSLNEKVDGFCFPLSLKWLVLVMPKTSPKTCIRPWFPCGLFPMPTRFSEWICVRSSHLHVDVYSENSDSFMDASFGVENAWIVFFCVFFGVVIYQYIIANDTYTSNGVSNSEKIYTDCP